MFSSLLSSLRGRQLLNCLALRPPIGPNAVPIINQKPNDKGVQCEQHTDNKMVQKAQLSLRGRAMRHVVEYFG